MGGTVFPRLVIAGTQSGVGKTTVCMGLLAALAKRTKVQPYKVGPDYIDPAYHTFITGRRSRNLDGWMLDSETVAYLFKKNMQGAGLAVVEGVMGLFDGAESGNDEGSTAQVAKIIKAPVILVVDGSGMAASGAAMVKGYRDFDPDLDLAGIIVNRVSGEAHYQLLREAVETYTRVKVFGYLPEEAGVGLPSRHLGLVPSVEIAGLQEKVDRLAKLTEETVEVDELLRLAQNWVKPVPDGIIALDACAPVKTGGKDKTRIAVAYDQAFNFYYWDSLELLEELGAEIVFFSPLGDRELPAGVSGLILGGGFPEVFAGALQENERMKTSIREALASGLPYYAECGGLMYLVETLEDFNGEKYEMTGWLKGSCRMTSQLQRFGYAHLELKEDCVFGRRGSVIRVHEFHRSRLDGGEGRTAYRLYRMKRGEIGGEWECGYRKGNGVAGYPHLHLYCNLDFARSLLAHTARFNKERGHTHVP